MSTTTTIDPRPNDSRRPDDGAAAAPRLGHLVRAELLRLRHSTVARVAAILVLVEGLGIGLLFAFMPTMIRGLTALNEVVPNATQADQMSAEQLGAFSLKSETMQAMVIDPLGQSGFGATLPVIAAILVGGLSVAVEQRRGSFTTALLIEPRRGHLLMAKLVALSIVIAGAAIAMIAARSAVLAIGLMTQDASLLVDPVQLWAVGVPALVLYAVLGFALGLLLRGPVAVIVTVGIATTVETVIRPVMQLMLGEANPGTLLPFQLAPDLAGYSAAQAIAPETAVGTGLGWPLALTVLAVWSLGLLAIAAIRVHLAEAPAVN